MGGNHPGEEERPPAKGKSSQGAHATRKIDQAQIDALDEKPGKKQSPKVEFKQESKEEKASKEVLERQRKAYLMKMGVGGKAPVMRA